MIGVLERSARSDGRRSDRRPRWQMPGTARWIWRTLTSMRIALVLLCLLALAAIPGSLLPQRPVSPGDVAMFRMRHPVASPLLERLSMFDVFTSAWFASVYLLLLVSLTGCVLPRARRLWRTLGDLPSEPPRHLEGVPGAQRLRLKVSADEALDLAAAALRRRRYRVRHEPGVLSADKGHMHEAANLMFHLSLLLLLGAVAVGHLYGFRGRVVVAEGTSFANTVTQYDEFMAGPRVDPDRLTPFIIRLRDFSATYQPDGPQRGAPRQFTARVVFRADPTAEGTSRTLTVNRPLAVDGTKVFLTGHGYAPRFTVRDGDGNAVFSGPVPFLPRDGMLMSAGAVKAPDARPTQLAFEGFFLPTAATGANGPYSAFPAAVNPEVLLTAYTGDLGLDSGVPQSVYRLDKARLDQVRANGKPLAQALRPGDTMTVPGGRGSITFDGVSEFANFQIARDPGRWLALAAAVLMLTGLLISLSSRPRRVWLRARTNSSAGGPATLLDVASPGHARSASASREVADLVELLASHGGQGRARGAAGAAFGGHPGPLSPAAGVATAEERPIRTDEERS